MEEDGEAGRAEETAQINLSLLQLGQVY